MDVKLKDEITRILIANPGISIGDIAKKTGNYYSYTHKVISEMESLGLVEVTKATREGREATICRIKEDYKKKWLLDLKKFLKSMMKDAEVKAAFLVMYFFILVKYLQSGSSKAPSMLSAAAVSGIMTAAAQKPITFDTSVFVILLIPALIAMWALRIKIRKRRN